jgi:hypothetical protein
MKNAGVLLLATLVVAGSSTVRSQSTGRVFLIVVDDLRYAPAETEGAVGLLGEIRDKVIGGSDLVAVLSTGPSSVETDLHYAAGAQRERLTQAMHRMKNPPAGTAHAAAPDRAASLTMQAVQELLSAGEKVTGRRKHLLLFASSATSSAVLRGVLGSPGATGDVMRQATSVAEAASRAGIAIHVLDPTATAIQDVLERLK